jgi:tetratricopeptide (TPR) repeat protein
MRPYVVALLIALVASSARAATPEETARAKEHFQKGRVHYDLKEYEAALREFKDGYRFVQDAVFLYNIAQCHNKLGQPREALDFYRNYLRKAPDAPNRTEVEKHIEEMEKLLSSNSAPPPPPAPAATAPPPEPRAARPPVAMAPPPPAPAPIVTEREAMPPVAAEAESPPFYKRWWFWTLAGVVVAGAAVAVVAGSSRGEVGRCPLGDCVQVSR